MSETAPPRHALLLSGDPKFLEATQQALTEEWPGCSFHRIHPGGEAIAFKIVSGEAGSAAVIDRRYRIKLAQSRILSRVAAQGGYVVSVNALPRRVQDLQAVELDDGFARLSHNLDWDSPLIGRAIGSALRTQSLTALAAPASTPIAQGKTAITDPKFKSDFVEHLAVELGEAGLQRTRSGKIASVLDELLMNSLYHAPKGFQNASHAMASWLVERKGAFRVTVTDGFGSYAREDAHRKVVHFLGNQMVEITKTVGRGGGVGLFMVFNASSEYFLYVDPGKKTEISIKIEPPGKGSALREVLIYYVPFRPKSSGA